MKLKQISYSEFSGGAQEWVLENLTFGEFNLLVGKNATGKTRTLNLISSLANLLSNTRKRLSKSGYFDVKFENNGDHIQYVLETKNSKVVQESLNINERNFMTRGQGGKGQIFAEEVNGGSMLTFQAPEILIAAAARQDEIQHKFLKPLRTWAEGVIHYRFGSSMGRNGVALIQNEDTKKLNPKQTDMVINFFVRGKNKFKQVFIETIINDLKQINYHVETIGTRQPNLPMPLGLRGEPASLYVKEVDLPGITDQFTMSSGMFRALSLIIQINYCQMENIPSCIIIDDIGEGLDFDRSVCLIDLLKKKLENSKIQLIMATNDRFTMNKVPLESWTLLKREGNHCKVYNYANSREKFEDFKFTGMNNFDFFMSDFIDEGLPENE